MEISSQYSEHYYQRLQVMLPLGRRAIAGELTDADLQTSEAARLTALHELTNITLRQMRTKLLLIFQKNNYKGAKEAGVQIGRSIASEMATQGQYDIFDVVSAVMSIMTPLAVFRRALRRQGSGGEGYIESTIINTASAQLVANVDSALVDPNLLAGDAEYLWKISELFGPMLMEEELPMERDFIMNKMGVIAELVRGRYHTEQLITTLSEHYPEKYTDSQEENLRLHNTELAKLLKGAAQFGIKWHSKPLRIGSLPLPEYDLSMQDATHLVEGTHPDKHTRPILYRVFPHSNQGIDLNLENFPANKAALIPKTSHSFAFRSDHNGELTLGLNVEGHLPLQLLFANRGRTDLYEMLRAEALTMHFDSVVPVTIAKQVRQSPESMTRTATKRPKKHLEEDKLPELYRTILFPRLTYLRRPTKELRADFEAAQQEEVYIPSSEETAKRRSPIAHDRVEGLTSLPEGYKASAEAVAKARKYYEEHYGITDFELPPGKTWRSKARVNPESKQQVTGYTAKTRRPK